MRTSVFGLDVRLPGPVEGCPRRPWADRPRVHVVVDEAGGVWDSGAAEMLVCEPAGGRPLLTVETSAGAYRVAWRHIGAFVVTSDGRIVCRRDPGGEAHWERYLTAQILPLAAVMAGIEVLHAAAVVVDGRAVGIVGPAGAGKSSTAQALVGLGAQLLTDDVLALSREDGHLVAHAGTDHVRIGPRDAKDAVPLTASGRDWPLDTLFFLERDARRPSIGRAVGFRALAGATFNLLVRTPERLERHLDLAGTLAGEGIPVHAGFPAGAEPDEVAGSLLDWLRSR